MSGRYRDELSFLECNEKEEKRGLEKPNEQIKSEAYLKTDLDQIGYYKEELHML